MPAKKEKMTFEAAKSRLEEIVRSMESGALPLAESLELYKEGAKLAEFCRKEVAEAEEVVRVITGGPDGDAVVKDFE